MPEFGSAREQRRRPYQDHATSTFGYIANFVTRVSRPSRWVLLVGLGAVVIWPLLSMTAPVPVLLAQSMCSSHIISIPFCSWGAFEEPLTGIDFGQPLDDDLGREWPTQEVKEGEVVGNGIIPSASDVEGKNRIAGELSVVTNISKGAPITDPDEIFNWPDGNVILRSTHDTESRDFRVHKLFLSFASPVFKDILTTPQSSASTVHLILMGDPPRAVELILRFIYPSSTPPVLDNLTIISEALDIAKTYKIEVAQSRLRASLMEFVKMEPLRVYAIACRVGFWDEMRIASTHTLSIHLPALTLLPEEFELIPATEYHRLVRLHTRYRTEVVTVTIKSLPSIFDAIAGAFDVSQYVGSSTDKRGRMAEINGAFMKNAIIDVILKGTPLDYRSLALALNTWYAVDVEAKGVGHDIRSILDKTNALNMTV